MSQALYRDRTISQAIVRPFPEADPSRGRGSVHQWGGPLSWH